MSVPEIMLFSQKAIQETAGQKNIKRVFWKLGSGYGIHLFGNLTQTPQGGFIILSYTSEKKDFCR